MKRVVRILFCTVLFFAALSGGIHFYLKYKEKNHLETVDEVFQENIEYQYYYEKANEKEQEIYKHLYYTLKTFQKDITLKNTHLKQIEKIYNDVLMDHPELFYVNTSFRYIDKNNDIQIIPQYDYDQKKVKQYNQQIEQSTQEIIQKANKKKTSIEKIKIIYDYLIETVNYQDNDNDQNLISALVDKKSVCAGYAKAYQYLLLKVGIESVYMTGVTLDNHDMHAWIMIHVNGDYYYSDPTWGDIEEEGIKHHCYGSFLMSSEDMLRCYQPSSDYEKTKTYQLNYYQNIGCYMEEYDRSVLSYAVQLGLKNKTYVAEVKCANEQVYQQLKNQIKNTYLGYYILLENHCYSEEATYSCRDDLRIIEIFF